MKIWLCYPFQNCPRLGPFITTKALPPFRNRGTYEENLEGQRARTTLARRWLDRDKTWSAPHEPGDFVVEIVTRLGGNDEEWHLGS